MGMSTACAHCRNTTTAMTASTKAAWLRTLPEVCEGVGSVVPFGTSSACTGGSGDVAIGFQRTVASGTVASGAILDHDRTACVPGVAQHVARGVEWPAKIR